MPFSPDIRRAIIQSANGQCEWEEGCGKSQEDGWMLHAAHLNHDRRNGDYNSESMGIALCVAHHLHMHLSFVGHAHLIGLSEESNNRAINYLYHTAERMDWWVDQHGGLE